jgi:hypothetical protein
MKKQIIGFLVAFLALFLASSNILADGMVVYQPDPNSPVWDYSDETSQQAFINYQNGLEKMIVGISIGGENKNAVWLFPVPSDPSKVAMDVIDDMPQMSGEEISSKAAISLLEAQDFLSNTQIYPALKSIFSGSMNSGFEDSLSAPTAGSMSLGLAKGGVNEEAAQDVVVYEHLDKNGMTSEIITAKTADGLSKYFQDKGLKIEKGMIPALDAYIGKNYSFVASWMGSSNDNSGAFGQAFDSAFADYMNHPLLVRLINETGSQYPPAGKTYAQVSIPEYVDYLKSVPGKPALDVLKELAKQDQLLTDDPSFSDFKQTDARANGLKGVSVMFPAKKMFFPLLPTSVYESKVVPATIKVVGFVDPEIYPDIANFTSVNYYSDANFSGSSSVGSFFSDKDPKEYTKIEINVPSKYLTQDLWINNRAPLKTVYSSFIGSHKWITAVILLLVFSLLAAFVSGWALLKGLRKHPGKLALLGAANCFSIIALIVAVFFTATNNDPKKPESESVLKEIRQKGYIWKRRTALALFAVALVSVPFSSSIAASISGEIFSQGLVPALFGLLLIYFPAVLAVIGWRAARIKYEDGPLFAQLKTEGYSAWTFTPQSGNKFLFVIFFSLTFLVISWIGIKLLQLTV